MARLTDRNVRLIIGLLASVTLLSLIVFDAVSAPFTLDSATIYLLAALIWAFLGIDVLNRTENQYGQVRDRYDYGEPPRTPPEGDGTLPERPESSRWVYDYGESDPGPNREWPQDDDEGQDNE